MSPVVDAINPQARDASLAAAAEAIRAGDVVVIPTDTVYGVGCDAFSPEAVGDLLAAKQRGREMPPPVLVGEPRTVDGLATRVPAYARDLIARWWPGPLTLVLTAQPSLHWDLGDTRGTVALRMPDDEVALTLLREVGPMAVTSANISGEPPARTAAEAAAQLGPSVAVYVDAGPRSEVQPSTIVDCTGERPQVLREGAISAREIDDLLAQSGAGDAPTAEAAPTDPPTTPDTTEDFRR